MNEIAKIEDRPLSVIGVISEALSAGKADAATIHALLDANERIVRFQAEIDFNEAMARLQKALPQVPRTASAHNSKYAKYEDADKLWRPFYTAEGFTIDFDTKGITHYGTISHKSGHSKTKQIDFPPDTSGGKNAAQAIISAASYAKRNLLQMLINGVTCGEDDDANGTSVIDTEQAAEIDTLIRDVSMNREKFLKVLKVDDVRSIRAKDYGRAINSLKAKKYDDLSAKGEK